MEQQELREDAEQIETTTRYVCTANHGFAPYAQEELRRTFGAVKSQVLQSGEVFLATLNGTESSIVAALKTQPPMFLRHMFPVQLDVMRDESSDEPHGADKLSEWVAEYARDWYESYHTGERITITVQVRKNSDSPETESALELKEHIEARWSHDDITFVVREADYVLSVYVAATSILVGMSKPEANLSDWNGGAVRFQREEEQISRAKFKLLEAERTFGIDFSSFTNALDIGAAPGGWTSFLLERGLSVTAVDPAKMHPSLLHNPKLTIVRKNADSVKFELEQFDLLVCDMSWSPKLTARLVIDLLYSLTIGGTAVVTIKLLSKKPLALIKEVTAMYTDARLQIVEAKQLFHNRDEITLYMIKY